MTSFGRHRLLLPILGWIFITSLVGLTAEPAVERPPADRLYVGGTILTVNDAQPRAEAVAVAGGRIIAVRVLRHLIWLTWQPDAWMAFGK